jgi:polysaccharide export outer membrane protein
MSARLIFVPACALSLLLGACAPDLEHMTSADLAITSDVTSSTVDYRPITADRVVWGPPTILPGDSISPAEREGPYRLDTGDRLRIFVYGQPNLSRLYVVDQAGKIAVPLIGNVRARGKTTNQLQAEYVKDPQVTVDIVQNRPFFILGEVKAGGQFPYVSGMTVETAVAIAGGYTERASEKTFRITRRANGFVEQIMAPSDLALMPGDTVYVFERFF